MKRRITILGLFCFIVLSVSITSFASVSIVVKEEQSKLSLPKLIDEINTAFSALSSDPAYGGIYYEEDTLIVNMVNDQPAAYQQIPSFFSAYPDVEIKYQYVKYSLGFLESVKDALAPQMGVWSISVLDANEITNQLDIYLSDYSNQVQSAIIQFVDDSFGTSDFLNFIDYSNVSIIY